ncbi:phage head closure protein [Bosea sp. (in: a-proteobacteria)]|uniref:phage head closure protein n=1 Tax=Bosea sp. (in: a-proteobacteria) TaxID=1871050 RepID=UPI003B3A184F
MTAAQDRIAIGGLRRRLSLEAPVETPDGLGGVTRGFVTVAAFWASVDWLGGAEQWRQGRPQQTGSHRIVLRWRAGVDAGMRLRDGARIFEIKATGDPDGSRRRLVCLADEVTP